MSPRRKKGLAAGFKNIKPCSVVLSKYVGPDTISVISSSKNKRTVEIGSSAKPDKPPVTDSGDSSFSTSDLFANISNNQATIKDSLFNASFADSNVNAHGGDSLFRASFVSSKHKLQLTVTNDDDTDRQLLYGIDPEVYADAIEIDAMTNLKCPLCSLELEFKVDQIESILNMQTHILSSHIRNDENCPVCGEPFRSTHKGDVAKHMLEHVNCKQYPCPMCSEHFITREEMIPHMYGHALLLPAEVRENPAEATEIFTCQFCSMRFIRKLQYLMHMETHFGKSNAYERDKPFCSICNMSFNDRHQYSQHMKGHGGTYYGGIKTVSSSACKEESNKCHICGRTFSHTMFLQCHIKYHEFGEPIVSSKATIHGTSSKNSLGRYWANVHPHLSMDTKNKVATSTLNRESLDIEPVRDETDNIVSTSTNINLYRSKVTNDKSNFSTYGKRKLGAASAMNDKTDAIVSANTEMDVDRSKAPTDTRTIYGNRKLDAESTNDKINIVVSTYPKRSLGASTSGSSNITLATYGKRVRVLHASSNANINGAASDTAKESLTASAKVCVPSNTSVVSSKPPEDKMYISSNMKHNVKAVTHKEDVEKDGKGVSAVIGRNDSTEHKQYPCHACGKKFTSTHFLVTHLNHHGYDRIDVVERGPKCNIKVIKAVSTKTNLGSYTSIMAQKTDETKLGTSVDSNTKVNAVESDSMLQIDLRSSDIVTAQPGHSSSMITSQPVQHYSGKSTANRIREVHVYQCCDTVFTDKLQFDAHRVGHWAPKNGEVDNLLPQPKPEVAVPIIMDNKIVCEFCYLSFDVEHLDFYTEHLKLHESSLQTDMLDVV